MYADSTSKKPGKLTKSKGWQVLMDQHLPDSLIVETHEGLMTAKRLDQIIFPVGAKLTDKEIGELVAETGCVLKKIKHGERATYVFFWAPDNRARKDAVDMAIKVKGKYAPTRVYTEPDPYDEMSDEQLNEELGELQGEVKKRRGKKSKPKEK